MSRRNISLVAVIIYAIVAAGLMSLGVSDTVVRSIFGIPLVIVLPGYAISAALFPAASPSISERLVWSLGASLATAILCGFLLHWTPWGINGSSSAIALAGVVVVGGVVALLRRQPASFGSAGLPFSIRHIVVLALAAAITVSATTIAQSDAEQQMAYGPTQLWMLPGNPASAKTVQIGIRNLEPTAQQYRLQLEAGGTEVEHWATISLQPGEQWQIVAALPKQVAGALEARLYRLDNPGQVYRHVALPSY